MRTGRKGEKEDKKNGKGKVSSFMSDRGWSDINNIDGGERLSVFIC
jgi:hypothetical protein